MMRHSLSMVPDESKEAVLNILRKENAVKFYNRLKEDDVPEDVISKTLVYSAERLAEGKNPTIGSYLVSAGSKLMELDKKYGRIIDEAYNEGILDEKEYVTIKKRIEDKKEKMIGHARKHLSELENRVAAVWLLVAIGAILMLVSGYTITAAVVGSVFEITLLFVIGFALFAAGIFLWLRKK